MVVWRVRAGLQEGWWREGSLVKGGRRLKLTICVGGEVGLV